MSTIVSWLTQKCFSRWSRGPTFKVFLDRIVAHAEAPRSYRGSRRGSFTLVAWSHLQGFARSYRGSRRSVFHIGYVVSPGRFSSIVSWLAQKCLLHRLRGLTCKVFLDRIVARAEASFTLVTWSHLEGFPRSYRGSRRSVFCTGCAVSPARFSSIVSWLAQKRLSHWLRGLTCKVFLDRIVEQQEAAGSSRKQQEAAGSSRKQQEAAGSSRKQQEAAGSSRKQQEQGQEQGQVQWQLLGREARKSPERTVRARNRAGSSRKQQEAAGSSRKQQEAAGSSRKQQEAAGSSRKQQEAAGAGAGAGAGAVAVAGSRSSVPSAP
jgi:hypothetical protein